MITISGLQEREVILASESQTSKTLLQVDLFGADNCPLGARARSEAQSPSTAAKGLPETAGAAQAVDVAQPIAEAEKTPPAPAHEAVSAENPWGAASGTPTAINFRPDMSLHAKMEWVCDNVPKMSRLRILREGATLLCDHLIAKHYRSQD